MSDDFDEALKKSEYEDYVSPEVVHAAITVIPGLIEKSDNDDTKNALQEILDINEEMSRSYNRDNTAFQEDIDDDNQNHPNDRQYDNDVIPHPYTRKEITEANEDLLNICDDLNK